MVEEDRDSSPGSEGEISRTPQGGMNLQRFANRRSYQPTATEYVSAVFTITGRIAGLGTEAESQEEMRTEEKSKTCAGGGARIPLGHSHGQ